MSQATPPQRWFSGWRATPDSRLDDPADLGTAFGLDLSMDDGAREPQPSQAEPESGWAQRLGLRRKPGA